MGFKNGAYATVWATTPGKTDNQTRVRLTTSRKNKKTDKEILEVEGYTVLIAHYGDLVKYVCSTFFGWDGKKDSYGRTLLQYVGTDVVRKQDSEFWVRFIGDILSFFKKEWDYVLIPDCRFPNEIEYLKSLGHEVLHMRVNRKDFDNGLSEEQKNHPSWFFICVHSS